MYTLRLAWRFICHRDPDCDHATDRNGRVRRYGSAHLQLRGGANRRGHVPKDSSSIAICKEADGFPCNLSPQHEPSYFGEDEKCGCFDVYFIAGISPFSGMLRAIGQAEN
jgi:hypothetical protein